MKRILISIISLLMINTVQAECPKHEKLLDSGAEAIAFVLNCKNYRGIREDVEIFAKKVKLCRGEKGLPPQVCSAVGKFAASRLRKRIPIGWLCQPDIAMKVVEVVVTQTCKKIIIGGFSADSNYTIR